MRSIRETVLLAVLFVAVSCGGKDIRIAGPRVLGAIPSDAVAFVYSDKAEGVLESVLDSESYYLQLNLGKYAKSSIAFSYHYNGTLSNMLVVELGKKDSPESESVADLIAQADKIGIMHEFVESEGKDGKPMLLLSRSRDILKSSRRHIELGESIVDQDGVQLALAKVEGKNGYVMFSNIEYPKMIPLGSSPYVPSQKMSSFVGGLCDWTVAYITNDGGVELETVQNDDSKYYINLLNSIKSSESHLGDILPLDCDFVISLQINSISDWIDARKKYLDAHAALSQYESRYQEEEDWVKSLNVKEVAYVRKGDSRVLLFRPAKYQDMHSSQDNPYAGYLGPVFGNVFSLPDEEYSNSCGEWIVWGDEADVNAFLANRSSSLPWTQSKTKAAVYQRLSEDTAKILTVSEENKLDYAVSVCQSAPAE